MNKLRVFLVDDHPVVRDGLRVLLDSEADMEVVGDAFDGETAVGRAAELRPDVVVMDVSMPGMGGIEATARIRAGCPNVRVVALTAHEDRKYVQQALQAGATGYVPKRAAAADLVGAIRHAAAGRTYLDPSVTGPYLSAEPATEATSDHGLSEREVEVLKQLTAGYSNKQIAARLEVSVKSVETYKGRAMEKLGIRSRVGLVQFAVRQGWLSGG
ncbi:Oxygen regulatory protein NreC [Gemmata obscuriglobus]|uniref:DNA-binding response regulator n=1 Tax=Gemmata obscuriglobus TaxID=114 RepID=A0A2Z3GZA2_9BACT|nr:response regulator transcription factor [Gemmata obscuriglobus]AWM39093.1 DNA-binding response regulator [Gemmata obscuriglobus]QEG27870.1 Oxygen regulatory protein NreC [Gemmata obscuriglobus]VTS05266.1 family transcriptional regulator : Two component transcriptional regulator, LuxR family OS=Methylocella silvestris (strain BL2 / DSM 15510 / NCIMB 13906) GN=Msil_2019 PE=4 SV=1: Response_reg: GerE [Gemmata obscuriglobus UQM 2246]